MDKVALEVEALASQQMFARMMEMILLELVSLTGDRTARARLDIDLDGVAVVDDAEPPRLIGDVDRLAELCRDWRFEVDRGLLDAELARLEFGRQLAPMARPGLALIGPVWRHARPGDMSIAAGRQSADR
jgi:hypothetical protein